MKFLVGVSVALGLGLVGVMGFHHFSNRPDQGSSSPGTRLPAAKSGWYHSWEQASAQARARNRPILADFTGSDWCPPCMALKSSVFDSQEFKAWAAERDIVLLEVDFPRRKAQDPAIKEQNRAMAQRLGVRSFPTVMILDADGQSLSRSLNGYGGEDAEAWIAKAERQWSGALDG